MHCSLRRRKILRLYFVRLRWGMAERGVCMMCPNVITV